MGVSFLCGALIARMLGVAGRGEVVYVVTWAAVVALVAAAGVVPATKRAGNLLRASSLVRPVVVVTGLRLVVVAALGLIAWAVAERPAGLDGWRLLILLALGYATALQTTVAGVAGTVARSTLASATYAAGTVVLAVGLTALAVVSGLGVTEILVLWAITSGVSVIVVCRCLEDGRPPGPTRTMLRWSTGASWGELALAATWRMDNLVVGGVLGLIDLGRYSAAVAVAEVAMALIAGVRLAMLRTTATDTARAAREALRLTLLVAAPAVVGAALLGPAAIRWLFGPEFVDLQVVLWTLLPGTVAMGLSTVLMDHVAGAGRTRWVNVAGVLALVVNLTANFLFLPRWGISGAALASTIAYGTAAATLWVGCTRPPNLRSRGTACGAVTEVTDRLRSG